RRGTGTGHHPPHRAQCGAAVERLAAHVHAGRGGRHRPVALRDRDDAFGAIAGGQHRVALYPRAGLVAAQHEGSGIRRGRCDGHPVPAGFEPSGLACRHRGVFAHRVGSSSEGRGTSPVPTRGAPVYGMPFRACVRARRKTAAMPFLELTIRCPQSEQPRREHALEDVGALAVTMLDAEAGTSDERAILEPGVGETPLWDEIALSALFPADADGLLLLAALDAFDPALDWRGASFRVVADQDWERAWMDQYAPLRFGARTWIVPWDHALPGAARADDAAVVRLDPGLAFGSGTHPTTALCLHWLDALAGAGRLQGASVLDFGCGSGILALAALALGAAGADAVDND